MDLSPSGTRDEEGVGAVHIAPWSGSLADDAFLRARKREREKLAAPQGERGDGRGARSVINFEPVKTVRWVTRD